MNASEDSQRITDWTKFVYQLTRYAGDTFANPATMPYSLSERGGRELFLEICEKAQVYPSFVTGVMDTVQDMNSAVMQGFRRSQPLIGCFPWYEWYEECDKEYIEDPFSKKKGKKMSTNYADFAIMADGLQIHPPIRAGAIGIDPRNFDEIVAVPPPPIAPAEPAFDRPECVPDHFVFRREQWCNPDFDSGEHRRILDNQDNVPYEPYATVPRGLRIDSINIKRQQLKFYGRNALSAANAIIVAISADATRVQVVADKNLIRGSRNYGVSPYWYSIKTGYWDGDPTLGFIH
jgi:hypothetical protein